MYRFVVLATLLISACTVPVRVMNDPERPVPTAPMGVAVARDDGTQQLNPQLGPPPEASAYETRSFPLGMAIGQALLGDWVGLAATVVAALAGGGMVHQRRRRQRAEADRDRLAALPPDEASKELDNIKRKG